MNKLLLSIVALGLIVGSLPARRCTCQNAGENDVPHGANETIEYSEKTVKSIKGVVYFPDSSRAEEVVVEVYAIAPEDKKLKTYEIVSQRTRRAACVTSEDGSFCFDDLPSGNYLIRAGARWDRGMNEVYVRLKLDRRWWSRWFRSGKEIELELTLGT